MAPESNRLRPGLSPPPAAFEVRGDVALCRNQEQDTVHRKTPYSVRDFLLNKGSSVDIFLHFNLMPTLVTFQNVFFNSFYDISPWKKYWSLDQARCGNKSSGRIPLSQEQSSHPVLLECVQATSGRRALVFLSLTSLRDSWGLSPMI